MPCLKKQKKNMIVITHEQGLQYTISTKGNLSGTSRAINQNQLNEIVGGWMASATYFSEAMKGINYKLEDRLIEIIQSEEKSY